MNFNQKVQKEWNRESRSLLGYALKAASFGYGLAVGLRTQTFASGIRETHTLPVPVVCVGNLVVGGVGKTPLVETVARFYLEIGVKPAVLSRGYKRLSTVEPLVVSDGNGPKCSVADAGDEPWMLAHSIRGAAVIVGADRVKSGLEAAGACKAQVLVLDDGYQHLRVARDLNICVLDARKPLGNGLLLPAGPLRESPNQLKRADLLYFTHAQGLSEQQARTRLGSFAKLVEDTPAAGGWFEVTGLCDIFGDWKDISLERARSEAVVALSGIGSPASFDKSLRDVGIVPAEHLNFPDHHNYVTADLERIGAALKRCQSRLVITTLKDAVRLMALKGMDTVLPPATTDVYALRGTLRTEWNASTLESALRSAAETPLSVS